MAALFGPLLAGALVVPTEGGMVTIGAMLDVPDYLSRATLNRLEALETEPTSRRDRRRAFLVVVLYGWDPADFGLSPEDRPPAIDLRALARLRLRGTGWLRGVATYLARAA